MNKICFFWLKIFIYGLQKSFKKGESMAGKRKEESFDDVPFYSNDEIERDEDLYDEEESDDESEDRGIDETLEGTSLGGAASDLDVWGCSDFEDN